MTAHIWHLCTTIDPADHLTRARPGVREALDRYVELIAGRGPVTVIAQKTRMVIMGRVRFAGAVVRPDKLVADFALTRRVEDRRLRIQAWSDRWIEHRFEVRSPEDLEIPGPPEWSCESHRDLGMQGAPMRRRRAGRQG